MAVSEGGFMSNYFYDCNGERTVKLSSGREALYVNASRAYNADSLPQKFVAYVSPYLVVKNGGQYTKHIYAGNQRIASKLGNIDEFGADPRRVDYAGADLKDINYDERYKSEVKELETRYDSLGTDCTFRVVNDYVNGKSFCCDNNDIEIFNRPDTESGNSEDAGIFFYHPDHLGSTAMVTDHEGRITQNVVYIPFGEVFVEQRDGNWNTPYLFNAKELDEETGLYYYGARYLDPTGAQWLSVDPLFEKYAGMSPYNYCAGNPVVMVDVDGKSTSVKYNSEEDSYTVVNAANDGDVNIYVIDKEGKRTGIIGKTMRPYDFMSTDNQTGDFKFVQSETGVTFSLKGMYDMKILKKIFMEKFQEYVKKENPWTFYGELEVLRDYSGNNKVLDIKTSIGQHPYSAVLFGKTEENKPIISTLRAAGNLIFGANMRSAVPWYLTNDFFYDNVMKKVGEYNQKQNHGSGYNSGPPYYGEHTYSGSYIYYGFYGQFYR